MEEVGQTGYYLTTTLRKGKMISMVCPYCSSKEVGKIGVEQFYCWNCYLEWTINENGKYLFYQVEEDGSLICLNDLFGDDWHKEA